jgi:AcrR family transcriptional regulator
VEERSKSANDGPAGLTSAIVVEAALRLMDAQGVEWLSMRKLAAELGVSAQALYWYFPSKDSLCEAVVASAIEELGTLPLGRGTPVRRAERYLRELRTHWRKHPSVITLGRRYPPTAAGAVAAQGTALMIEMGFDADRAVDRHRALVWIVLGFVYVEQGVSQSAHHHPVDGSSSRYGVRLAGDASEGNDHHLDTDRLFSEIIRTALRGLVAELAD